MNVCERCVFLPIQWHEVDVVLSIVSMRDKANAGGPLKAPECSKNDVAFFLSCNNFLERLFKSFQSILEKWNMRHVSHQKKEQAENIWSHCGVFLQLNTWENKSNKSLIKIIKIMFFSAVTCRSTTWKRWRFHYLKLMRWSQRGWSSD